MRGRIARQLPPELSQNAGCKTSTRESVDRCLAPKTGLVQCAMLQSTPKAKPSPKGFPQVETVATRMDRNALWLSPKPKLTSPHPAPPLAADHLALHREPPAPPAPASADPPAFPSLA